MERKFNAIRSAICRMDWLSYPSVIRWFEFLGTVPLSKQNRVHFWKYKFWGIRQAFLRWGHCPWGFRQAALNHASLPVSDPKSIEFYEFRISWIEINQFVLKQRRDKSRFPAANFLNPQTEIISNDFCSIRKARRTLFQCRRFISDCMKISLTGLSVLNSQIHPFSNSLNSNEHLSDTKPHRNQKFFYKIWALWNVCPMVVQIWAIIVQKRRSKRPFWVPPRLPKYSLRGLFASQSAHFVMNSSHRNLDSRYFVRKWTDPIELDHFGLQNATESAPVESLMDNVLQRKNACRIPQILYFQKVEPSVLTNLRNFKSCFLPNNHACGKGA